MGHFGPKYLVELEMMMEDTTPLRQSHDAGISLQHAIESELGGHCERCFVHIDYQTRIGEDGRSIDHDPSVPIEKKVSTQAKPLGGSFGSAPHDARGATFEPGRRPATLH